MKWVYKLERKIGRYAIPNLMLYITTTTLFVYLADLLLPTSVSSYLAMVPSAVFRGQIWRLVTYIFIPPTTSPIFLLFTLYFYYIVGNWLEAAWGSFKFNVYYFVGMIGTTLASLFTGFGTAFYLNMSLFFAYAMLWPDHEVLIFFVIPVKIKYLAYLDAALFLLSFLMGSWGARLAIIMSLLNFFLFFGRSILQTIKDRQRYRSVRNNFNKQMKRNDNYRW